MRNGTANSNRIRARARDISDRVRDRLMDAGRRRRGRETHGVRGPNRGDGRAFLSCISIDYKNGIIWDISRRERKTIPATEGGRCARAIRNRVRVGRSEHARTVPRGRRESSRGGAAASGDGARAVDARPPFGATGVGESGEAPAKGSERVGRGCQMVNTRESGGAIREHGVVNE
jgi:hypothetical protein